MLSPPSLFGLMAQSAAVSCLALAAAFVPLVGVLATKLGRPQERGQ